MSDAINNESPDVAVEKPVAREAEMYRWIRGEVASLTNGQKFVINAMSADAFDQSTALLAGIPAPASTPKEPALTLENAPVGTKAPASSGGYWYRTERGWKWNTGNTFPRPGGDWTGELIAPDTTQAEQLAEQFKRAVEGPCANPPSDTSHIGEASKPLEPELEASAEKRFFLQEVERLGGRKLAVAASKAMAADTGIVQELPPLPEPINLDEWTETDLYTTDLFTADQMREYARAALSSVAPQNPTPGSVHVAGGKPETDTSLKALLATIQQYIKQGPLSGNGCDETAERNGLILAANIVSGFIRKSGFPLPNTEEKQ